MAISSRWLDALQEQFLAEQAASPYDPRFSVDAAPSLGGMRMPDAAPDSPDMGGPVGASSGLAPEPGSSSYLDQVIAGGAAGGVGGGLAALFADPNADRSGSGANAWDMFRGITKSIGRAIGSAYGNPNFGLAAQRVEQEGAYNNALMERAQAETEQALREQAEKRARGARIMAATEGLNPTKRADNDEAVRRLSALGEYEAAKQIAGLLREDGAAKPPETRRVDVGGEVVTQEFDPDSQSWSTIARAPRWDPRGGDRVNVSVNTTDTLKTAMDTRNQYLKESSDFTSMRDARDAIMSVNEDQTPAADMGMIFSYMKMLDPTSTVREGEYASAKNTAGLPDMVRNLYNQTVDRRILTPKQRADFISATDKLYKPRLEQQQRRERDYLDTLNRFDLPAEKIIPPVTESVTPFFGNVKAGGSSTTGPKEPEPLPSDPSQLKAGMPYLMKDGRVGIWNGRGFEVM